MSDNPHSNGNSRAPRHAGHALPGRLIAVEGVDGSGKSTQIHLLHQWLLHRGIRVYYSEWNSSELVKSATSRGKKNQLLTPNTFSLIHATDFADRYERQILPFLKAGYIVLCDRYKFTAFARDGIRGCDPEILRELYGFAIDPDITFYFDVPLEMAYNRIIKNRRHLKWFEAGMDLGYSMDPKENFRKYQGGVMSIYRSLAPKWNFQMIDATRNVHEVQGRVRELVAKKIRLDDYSEPSLGLHRPMVIRS